MWVPSFEVCWSIRVDSLPWKQSFAIWEAIAVWSAFVDARYFQGDIMESIRLGFNMIHCSRLSPESRFNIIHCSRLSPESWLTAPHQKYIHNIAHSITLDISYLECFKSTYCINTQLPETIFQSEKPLEIHVSRWDLIHECVNRDDTKKPLVNSFIVFQHIHRYSYNINVRVYFH